MVRKSSKSSRSRRAPCSGARKSNCAARKNCAWKKSRGCRRNRSAARMSKYEKVYKSVVRRAGKRRSRKSKSRSPRRRLSAYNKFVKANMQKVSGRTAAMRMKKVAVYCTWQVVRVGLATHTTKKKKKSCCQSYQGGDFYAQHR